MKLKKKNKTKVLLDSEEMYPWWYTFTRIGGGGLLRTVLGCTGR